jgi:hypothetical protein
MARNRRRTFSNACGRVRTEAAGYRRLNGLEPLERREVLAYTGPIDEQPATEIDYLTPSDEQRERFANYTNSLKAQLERIYSGKAGHHYSNVTQRVLGEVIDRKLNGSAGKPPLSEIEILHGGDTRVSDAGEVYSEIRLTRLDADVLEMLRTTGVRVVSSNA